MMHARSDVSDGCVPFNAPPRGHVVCEGPVATTEKCAISQVLRRRSGPHAHRQVNPAAVCEREWFVFPRHPECHQSLILTRCHQVPVYNKLSVSGRRSVSQGNPVRMARTPPPPAGHPTVPDGQRFKRYWRASGQRHGPSFTPICTHFTRTPLPSQTDFIGSTCLTTGGRRSPPHLAIHLAITLDLTFDV